MDRNQRGTLQGWPLTGVATAAIGVCVIVILATAVDPVDGLRRAIRVTARTSLGLFLLAFTAAALWQLWPGAWTRWQRQNRRYLGVAFAASHFMHLGVILALGQVAPAAHRIDQSHHVDPGWPGLRVHRGDGADVLRSHDADARSSRLEDPAHHRFVLCVAGLRQQLCWTSRDVAGVHRPRRARHLGSGLADRGCDGALARGCKEPGLAVTRAASRYSPSFPLEPGHSDS